MAFKGIFAGKPALFQLFLLIFFVLVGTMLSGLLGLLFMDNSVATFNQSPHLLRFIQFVSAICTFLLPVLAVAWLCSNNPGEYLFIKKFPDIKVLSLTFISMILLSPAITLTGLLNKDMKLPSFMEPVEKWMQSFEASAEKITELLMSDADIVSLLFNLLVIAITAGIAEEFFFRGALQRIIGKWFTNQHAVIWSVAFMFSAMHMQFYGFLPRFLLGAYFGYLLYWSKNIWIPVFAHFTNNAIAVIGMSNTNLRENEYISGEISDSELLPFAASALLCFFFFCVCVKYLKRNIRTA